MDLPDIPTSVAFWAGIATLWSAAGAWFTYVATAYKSRSDAYEGVRNLLIGFKVELDFIRQWASGDEGDPGHVLPTDLEQLVKSKPDWFNPSRFVFRFETSALQQFTSSPFARKLGPIVEPLVRLNYSFRRFLDLHADYRAFATADPALYASVFRKNKQKSDPLSKEEQDYLNVLFDMNLRMHRDLIGGQKSTDELCLYWAYRSAKAALVGFEGSLRREALPRWFWVLHVLAAFLALDGVWQVLRWFSLLQRF